MKIEFEVEDDFWENGYLDSMTTPKNQKLISKCLILKNLHPKSALL